MLKAPLGKNVVFPVAIRRRGVSGGLLYHNALRRALRTRCCSVPKRCRGPPAALLEGIAAMSAMAGRFRAALNVGAPARERASGVCQGFRG